MKRTFGRYWWMICSIVASAHAVCAIPTVKEVAVSLENVIVYDKPGKFCGWPANNGIWTWGDNEILVGFTLGDYRATDKGHSIDGDKPKRPVQARSRDGGKTWKLENPPSLTEAGDDDATECPGGLDFSDPDFAMKFGGIGFFAGLSGFLVSDDRGKTWAGPYRLPPPEDSTLGSAFDLTPRTDYVVNGPEDCFFFLSLRKKDAFGTDRVYCSRTTDGGGSIDFVSWVNPEPHTVRGVMPSTVRVSKTEFISALRRKTPDKNWIDAFRSTDNGATWHFLSTVTETDTPDERRNGNPPSLVRLGDGRLCLTYGYRAKPYGIRARISDDGGTTWGRAIILRKDALSWDMGYTRTVQRPDGKLVTVYYYTTQQFPEQHIAATIWDPGL